MTLGAGFARFLFDNHERIYLGLNYMKSVFQTKKLVYPQSVGERLKKARQRQCLGLVELEKSLGIRKPYLQALEESTLSALPGLAYARIFLKQYAAWLGLPTSLLVKQFDEEVAKGAWGTKGNTLPPAVTTNKDLVVAPQLMRRCAS